MDKVSHLINAGGVNNKQNIFFIICRPIIKQLRYPDYA